MIENCIKKLVDKKDLSKMEATAAMEEILEGKVTSVCLAAFLTALKLKGETSEEISAFVRVLRGKSQGFCFEGERFRDIVDTCGTGGDEKSTFNISTTAAFIAAGAGVKIAKHGNRSVSSKCGSADVLEALGVSLSGDFEKAKLSLGEAGFAFLFAPNHHQAIRHAMPVRKELGYKTVFNILGPLANPASAKRQLIGVYSKDLVHTLAKVLLELGMEHGMVVHGIEGLDEISSAGETLVAEVKNGEIKEYIIKPEDYGFEKADIYELVGGNPQENGVVLKGILEEHKITSGEKEKSCPFKDGRRTAAILNGGAAIYISGRARSMKEGISMAELSLVSGSALSALERYIHINRATVQGEGEKP